MAIAIPAPRVRVLGVEAFEQPVRLRMPFRFGVITLTESIQAIVRVRVRLADGREGFGYAAEMLAAKWFDKNPLLSDAQNQHQLRKAVELAATAYLAAPRDRVRAVRRQLPYRSAPPRAGPAAMPQLRQSRCSTGMGRPPVVGPASGRELSNLAGMAPHPLIADPA